MKQKIFAFLYKIFIPFLLLGWCVGHYFVQKEFLFSPWYGGGFAMFSSMDKGDPTRAMRVWRKNKKGGMRKLSFRENQESIDFLNLPSKKRAHEFLSSQNFKKNRSYMIEVFHFDYSNKTRKLHPKLLRKLRLIHE